MNSKDLLEQLRTVHFALLLICLATVVVIGTPDFVALSASLEQARDLSAVQAKWNAEAFADAIAKEINVFGTCVNAPKPINEALNLPAIVGPFNPVITRKWDLRYEGVGVPLEAQPIEKVPILKAPKTVQDFRTVWNARLIVTCPRPNLLPLDGELAKGWDTGAHEYAGTPPQTIHWIKSSKSYPIKKFIWIGSQPSLGWDRAALLESSDEHWWWVIPTRGSPKDVDTHVFKIATILQRLTQNKGDIADLSFEANFPKLTRLPLDQQAMSLNQLQKQLESKLAEVGAGLTAFSIKFPIEVSRRWAVFFIVLAQIYFLVHFAEYCRRGRPKEDVAWIGAYNRIEARALTWVTIYMLPVVVVWLAAHSQTDVLLREGAPYYTAVSALISVRLIVTDLRAGRQPSPATDTPA